MFLSLLKIKKICLNFFKSDSVNSDTCLVYPNYADKNGTVSGLKSISPTNPPYYFDDGFTFDFFINPTLNLYRPSSRLPGQGRKDFLQGRALHLNFA